MCRFTLYLGPPVRLGSLLTEPENSLIHQSIRARKRREPLNGDGFGVAWYVPDMGTDPAVFRSITPAWSNNNLRHVAAKTKSHCILAHVRAASPGSPVAEPNTHPFAWRDLACAHNGEIATFRAIKRALLASLSPEAFELIEGTTDSEHLFALVVDELIQRPNGDDPAARLAAALTRAIARTLALSHAAGIAEPSMLNVVVTDGRQAVVSRYASGDPEKAESLFVRTGGRYTCEEGVAHLAALDGETHSVIVSSEPLTDDDDWTAVPGNALVVVGPDRSVEIRSLQPG